MSAVEFVGGQQPAQDLTVEAENWLPQTRIQEHTGIVSERVLHPHKNLRSSECIAGHKKASSHSRSVLESNWRIPRESRLCFGATLGTSVDTHVQGDKRPPSRPSCAL
jgi:hypothetical protein